MLVGIYPPLYGSSCQQGRRPSIAGQRISNHGSWFVMYDSDDFDGLLRHRHTHLRGRHNSTVYSSTMLRIRVLGLLGECTNVVNGDVNWPTACVTEP